MDELDRRAVRLRTRRLRTAHDGRVDERMVAAGVFACELFDFRHVNIGNVHFILPIVHLGTMFEQGESTAFEWQGYRRPRCFRTAGS